jgi:aminomethyltransferase
MEIGLIAIQGPSSRKILQSIINQDISKLKFYHFIDGIDIAGSQSLISRTGYTGELGYEIYTSTGSIKKIWENLIEEGRQNGLIPAGLGCRDTLRLEMSYLLYGNDINQKINPIEAGLGWITKLNKGDFLGRESIIQSENKINKRIFCFSMLDRAIPRRGCEIIVDDKSIGIVTSGTMSPMMKTGIGMGYIEKAHYKLDSKIKINIRGNLKEAMIVAPPFYKKGSLHH